MLMGIAPYLGLGLVAGFFAGLLGIGGGSIMVPVLMMIFTAQGLAQTMAVHMALGTSMASIVPTAIASAYHHHQRGAVRWDIWQAMVGGILLGTLGMSFFASYLSPMFLSVFFSVFISLVAIQMFLDIKPEPGRTLPGRAGLGVAGFVIGGISALVAIGGGTMSVPFLGWCNIRIQHAIATSSALGAPIAIAGAMGYVFSGWGEQGLPDDALGYVYWPAVATIAAGSMLTVAWGVRLAHRLPVPLLKKVFAVVLVLLAARMLATVMSQEI